MGPASETRHRNPSQKPVTETRHRSGCEQTQQNANCLRCVVRLSVGKSSLDEIQRSSRLRDPPSCAHLFEEFERTPNHFAILSRIVATPKPTVSEQCLGQLGRGLDLLQKREAVPKRGIRFLTGSADSCVCLAENAVRCTLFQWRLDLLRGHNCALGGTQSLVSVARLKMQLSGGNMRVQCRISINIDQGTCRHVCKHSGKD